MFFLFVFPLNAILAWIIALYNELPLVMPSDARDGSSSIYRPAVDNLFVFKL